MTLMTTATGHEVDLAMPMLIAAISASMISHHLSLINRFTGATRRPYSVAEHSLLVADIAVKIFEVPPAGALAALLHDAHESFTSDVSTPLKETLRQFGVPYQSLEERWQRVFQRAFKCQVASTVYASQIRRADLIALATERRDVMPRNLPDWAVLEGIQPAHWVNLRDQDGVSWLEWRRRFSQALHDLESERDRAALALIPKESMQ